MKFILASSNAHKAKELHELLSIAGITINASPDKIVVIEDSETFEGNAFKKAKAYFEKFKTPTLADDSGLVVEERKDILGVHSARYAPHLEDYKDKNLELLEDLKNLEDRKAYFVCHLCFYISPEEIYFFEGRVHGTIAKEATGSDGFGYDPIFLPDGVMDGKSLAELPEWKMENSHRAKSCRAAVSFFKEKK